MATGMIAALAAAVLSVTTGLLPAAGPGSASSCTWRLAAVRLYQELTGIQDSRAVQLRALLGESGAGRPDFVPEQCRSGSGNTGSAGGTGSSGAAGSPAPGTSGAGSSGTAGPGTGGDGGSDSAAGSTGSGTTAAATFGWGQPNRVDEFTDASSLQNWSIYDGPGHAGNGRRSPSAVTVANGVLTITGDSSGTTAGMAWNPGQKYGRWEGRVRAPASDPSYNALLLLWPDAENFPIGGEIDFMEMMDHTRQETNIFLHYGAENSQVNGKVQVDAAQWHNWAVEWTPTHVAAFVDGKQWWRTTEVSTLPPGPMHLCIQLDWFPKGGTVQQSQMQADWVKQYPLAGSATTPTPGDASGSAASPGSSGSDSSGTGSASSSGS